MISRRSRVFAQTLKNVFSGINQRGRKRMVRRKLRDQASRPSVEILEPRALLTPFNAVNISQAAPIVLTAPDSAAAGDNLTVGTNITVASTGGAVTLNAGDSAFLFDTSTVTANSTITVNLDAGDLDAGVGSDSAFAGALNATSVLINGGPDNDFVSLAAASYATSPVSFAAAGGVSNQLDINVTGVTNPSLVLTGVDSGIVRSDSHQVISYSDVVNDVSSSSGTIFPSGGRFQSLVIDMTQMSAGNNASTDSINIVSNGSGAIVVSVNGQVLATAAETHFNEILVTGSNDSDRLFVDHSAGVIGLPITYAGGAGLGQDSLHVIGNGTTNAIYIPSSTTTGSGTVNVDGGAALITFSELAPVDISGMAQATISLPNAANTLTIADGASFASAGQQAIRVEGSSGGTPVATAAFFDNTSVIIDTSAVAGTDGITVSEVTGPHGNTNLSIDAGTGLGDEIILNGSVTTSGNQTYSNAAVDLTADVVLTSSASGEVTFSDAAIDGAHGLTINTNGIVDLGSDVGASQALTTLTTDANGTVRLPAAVTTSGAQTYGDDVVLTTATTLTASAVNFNDDVEATATGVQSLDIVGNMILGDGPGDYMGRTNALAHLSVSGSTQINAIPVNPPTIATTNAAGGTGSQTFGGAVVLSTGADTTLSATGGDVSFQATVDGPASLVVNADGVTTFTGVVGFTTAVGSITTDAAGSTTILSNVSTSLGQTYNDAVSISGNGNLQLTGTAVNINNTVALGLNTLSISAIDTDNHITGVISGTGGVTYNGSTVGSLFLDADNTYSGSTSVMSGTLVVATTAGLGTAASGTTVATDSTLRLAGDFTSLEPIDLLGAVDVGVGVTAELSGPVVISAATGTFGSDDATATLTVSGVISGSTGLQKTGAGTLILSAANTYTGATEIVAGSALVTGSLAAGTAVTVQNGATLGGNGMVADAVAVLAGGSVHPGAAAATVGVFQSGDFSLASGSALVVDIAGKASPGTDYDVLTVNGTVTLAGDLTINDMSAATAVNGDAILLIGNDGSDAVSGTFDGLAPGAAVSINGQAWRILYDGGDGNDVVLVFSPASITVDDITMTEGDSGTTDFVFTATLDSPVGGSFQVSYATSDDTANSANGDYIPALANLSFAGVTAGEMQTITVSVTGDSIVEASERFFLNLNNIIAGTNSAVPVISNSQAVANITNDDQATLSINDVSVVEGDSGTATLTFDVTLNGAVDSPLTVDFSTSDDIAASPSDYATQAGQLSFDGNAGEVETINIVVSGDTAEEQDETLQVLLSNIQVAGRDVIFADDTGVGTITDDDRIAVELTASVSAGTEVDETIVTLTATAASAVSGAQTVDLVVSGAGVTGSDYTLSESTITIADGQTTGTATFTIQDDAVVEVLETATVALSDPSTGVRVGSVASVDINISDNDSATLSINDASVTEGASGTSQLTFTVTLDQAVDTGISLVFQTVDGTAVAASDYTSNSDTLNFAGTAGETMAVVIDVAGDQIVEVDEGFTVQLSSLDAAGRNVTFADAQGAATITNDDAATLSIDDVTAAEGDSGQTAFSFTVTLDAAVDSAFTIDAATAGDTASGSTDYTAFAGTQISFAGTAGETQTVDVQVTGDSSVEVDETFFVNLTNILAGSRAITFADDQGLGTISNDDSAVAVNLTVDLTGTASETAGTVVTLTATADSAVAGDQTVEVDVTGTGITAADYILSASSITILDGQTTGTVTFTVADDATVEILETATISLANPSLGLQLGTTTSQQVGISDNDAATISIADLTLAEGDSGATVFTFTATLDNAVDTSVVVNFDTASGTATVADGDFVANTGNTITFGGAAGETQTIDVTVTGDSVVERTESFLVNLSNIVAGSRNVTFADNQALGTITNDDSATLSISEVMKVEENAGTTNFVFTVTLDNAVDAALTVDYDTADGTATAGSDYTANTGNTLAFTGTAGETQTVTVVVSGDTTSELDETFLVNLSNLASSNRDVTIAATPGIGTIIDDDGIAVDLTANVNAGTEADATVVTLTVTAASAVSGDQTVDLVVTGPNVDGSDYALSTSTVTILDGQTTGTATFTVTDDAVAELTEAATIQLANPSLLISQGTVRSQVVTLTDNDSAAFSISDATVTEGDSGTTTLTFTVTLDSAVDAAVSVDAATADGTAAGGSDYSVTNSTLDFTGIAGETRTFQVDIAGDTVVELDETLTATLSNPVGNGRTVTISDAIGDGTIANNDSASLSIADASVVEGDTGTANMTFTVTLTGDVESSFTVDYATADSSATVAAGDYNAMAGTLAFAGTDGETQTLTVPIVGDETAEPVESFLVNLSNVLAGGRSVTLADASASGTINDEDGVPVNLSVDVATGSEAAETIVSVVAVASSAVTGDQTLTVGVSGTGLTASDYTLGSTTITIVDGQTVGTTTFTIANDADVETTETAVLTISNPTSGLSLGATTTQNVQIISDDAASLSIDDVTRSEGASGTTDFTFTVTLDSVLTTGFTVDYATADDTATVAGGDYTAASGTLTFSGAAGETQTITVTVMGDDVAEVTESFFVNLSGLTGNVEPVTITDAQGIGTITTDDNVFVNLSSNVSAGSEAAETIITLTATADQAVTGDQTVALTVSGAGLTSGDYALSSNTITILDGQTTGTATFTVQADNVLETTETATVTIATPSAGVLLGATTSVDLSITDGSRPALDTVDYYPGERPTVTWQPVQGAVRYEIWFSRITPAQSRIFSETTLTSTSYTPPVDLAAAVYRYWVRAFDADGVPSRWSSDNNFEVQPTLLSPVNPTFDARPTFTWEPIPFATAYQIFVRTRSGDVVETDINGTSWTPAQDLAPGPIRWWIRATDSIGNRGWSQVGLTNVDRRTNVTGPVAEPSNNTPTITWQPVDGAGRYILHVQRVGETVPVIRQDQLTGTSYTPSVGLPSGSYRVWVKAIDGTTNAFGDSFWSRPLDFSISSIDTPSTELAVGGGLGQLLPESGQERQQANAATPAVVSHAADAKSMSSDVVATETTSTDESVAMIDALMSAPLELTPWTNGQTAPLRRQPRNRKDV